MRLIAIPLARASKSSAPVATFLAQRSPKALPNLPNSTNQTSKTSQDSFNTTDPTRNETNSDKGEDAKQLPFSTRMMQKASDFWIGLGKPDQKSFLDWKRRTYNTGEKLMDRIEYEEWALKGVDPALGPNILHPNSQAQDDKNPDGGSSGNQLEKEAKIGSGKLVGKNPGQDVPLLFPPSLVSPTPLLASLRALTASRSPHHRRRMWWCIIGAPFTAPFMLVPVVPNLPFFYLVWRAWSHWKAFKSSTYLEALIAQNRLIPTASPELDKVFTTSDPNPKPKSISETSSTSTSSSNPDSDSSAKDHSTELILKDFHIPLLIKNFNLDSQMGTELNRALMQTQNSIKQGKFEKIERAAEHGSREEK